MARLYPFRALRYDPARVNMEDVVTQPYDKITPAMQQHYYEASPYNLIRVILGKHEPGDTEAQDFLPHGEQARNVYTRAAETLREWRRDRVLAEESEPAVYGYSQTYTVPCEVPGTPETRERRGFIALGHLYDYADKVVYRHEQTFPKHKSDRLALFKATRAYCEQIYMLYSDPAFTAEKLIFGASGPGKDFSGMIGPDTAPADLAITDEYNVVHRVWKITDPNTINLLLTAMADKKLIIADGHHRYETSVAYAKERSAQLKLPFKQAIPGDEDSSPSVIADGDTRSTLPVPAFPEAAMMMTFVNMDAPGITILPTHRVVHGLTSFSSPDFVTKASAFFNVKELPTPDLAALNATPGTAFLAATGDGNYLLTPKPDVIAAALKGISPRQAQLDVVQLHSIILDKLLGLDQDTITRLGNVRYIREADEATALVASGDADIAFLIKPITLDQLRDISLSGDVMPQKSTDFYPKLLSGLAIYALD
ncbi:DUF1015 domain-containing protein [Tunturibacter empetritectus]|uniref:Uncharacterized protein (DUF1015 family) n=1 Tax=Tunturiibacter empetritectus TaxID=3069691 RepID=A0A7W8MT62_9BACT|nr:DUF1015 domain-containing protein [Edaphobacter lichenicola]MBB5317864.1 uncharacterized protein (DUF1015 family) [Edaphobacter lichenicola]